MDKKKLDLYTSENKYERTLVCVLDTLNNTKALLEELYAEVPVQYAKRVKAGAELIGIDAKMIEHTLELDKE